MIAPEVLSRRVSAVRAADACMGVLAAAGFGVAASLAFGSPLLGILVAVTVAAILSSRTSTLDAARRLERRDRELDGAVTAFVEGGGGRLRDDLAAWIVERRPRASYRRSLVLLACATAAIAVAFLARSTPSFGAASSGRAARQVAAAVPVPFLRVTVDVVPPPYARRAATHVDGPSQPIEALKGSTATLRFETSRPTVELTEEGGETESLPVVANTARRTLTLSKSTAIRIGAELIILFDVLPDRAPEVELALPREDRTVTVKPDPFDVKAAARDDVGLESLALFYTLAHGRGEGMTFKSGRIDGPRTSGVSAEMSTRIDPGALGLGVGDTLVIWAEATDGNAVDGPSRTASSVRLLRWDEELARIEMKSSAPAVRPLNGPLSQREILARTIRLLGEGLPREKLRERSLDLAEEQGKLRDAFGFFLRAEDGNAVELDMEEKEAGEEGSNRARRLLAAAVSEMWSAEAELSTGNPQASVPHQRLALKRLDEAFGNERYALRALAPPKAPVDERRRLKGDPKGLAPRTAPDPPEERPATARLGSLARRLLLASELRSSVPARELADELWALPEMANLSRSSLAAPLYAARSVEETSRAARAAADALLRYLEPHPVARPAVSSAEEKVISRLDQARPSPAR